MAEASARRDPALLLDIVLAARDALSFIADQDEFTFQASALHHNAVIRSLEVIGEAANRVSLMLRASLPDVRWSEMIGMRHWLIHGYEDLDMGLIWRTARDDRAQLIARLEPMIRDEDSLEP